MVSSGQSAAVVKSYSHPAARLDQWVLEKSSGAGHGIFVECGAYNGVHNSDTLLLDREYAWRGLLVEPDPEVFKELWRNRSSRYDSPFSLVPRNRFDDVAVAGAESDAAPFYLGGSWGGLVETAPPEWHREHRERKTKTTAIKTITLDQLLVGNGMPSSMDYLSLDTEGSEYQILERFFDDQRKAIARKREPFKFRFVTVEFRYDSLFLQILEELMSENGYRLDDVRGFDACFVGE